MSTGVRRTDGFAKTMSRSACVACRRAIKNEKEKIMTEIYIMHNGRLNKRPRPTNQNILIKVLVIKKHAAVYSQGTVSRKVADNPAVIGAILIIESVNTDSKIINRSMSVGQSLSVSGRRT